MQDFRNAVKSHGGQKTLSGFQTLTELRYKICLFSLLLIALLSQAGCKKARIPEITPGVDGCAHCDMVISDLRQACGYFVGSDFVPFDSPGCLLSEYEKIKKEDGSAIAGVYFGDYDGGGFVSADSTYFLITDHLSTVMNSGVLCFAAESSAQSHKHHVEEEITDWLGYQIMKGTPDRVVEATITPSGMRPEVVVVKKGELVKWLFHGSHLDAGLAFYLKGYDELGEITVPADDSQVEARMLADKPGAGFPFVRAVDETPIGMVKVAGAHTSDEEEM